MSMNPFFSVLVPVYNQVGKMDKCVSCLKAQGFRDFEVIFTNDGSTDDSAAMLAGFAKEDGRFRVTSHERNASLLAARYTGMRAARGRYILFLDSDDWLEDNALEALWAELAASPETEILRFGYIHEPDGTVKPPYPTEDPRQALLNGEFPPAIWKNCYRKDVIDRLLERTEPFYCNMGEDVFFSGVLFGCAQRFRTLDRNLYHYDLGTGMSSMGANLSPKKTRRDLDSVAASGSRLIAFAEKYLPDALPQIRRKAADMICFVLVQNVLGEKDWNRVAEHLEAFDAPDIQPYRLFACEQMIPLKMRFSLGLMDRETLWNAYLERKEQFFREMGL